MKGTYERLGKDVYSLDVLDACKNLDSIVQIMRIHEDFDRYSGISREELETLNSRRRIYVS